LSWRDEEWEERVRVVTLTLTLKPEKLEKVHRDRESNARVQVGRTGEGGGECENDGW
jgi:hypothetical protein